MLPDSLLMLAFDARCRRRCLFHDTLISLSRFSSAAGFADAFAFDVAACHDVRLRRRHITPIHVRHFAITLLAAYALHTGKPCAAGYEAAATPRYTPPILPLRR